MKKEGKHASLLLCLIQYTRSSLPSSPAPPLLLPLRVTSATTADLLSPSISDRSSPFISQNFHKQESSYLPNLNIKYDKNH